MLVDTMKVKQFITEPNLEVELRPLLLYRGSLTIGRAKTCFNFLRYAMEAKLPNMTEISRASGVENDIAHLCGFHAKAQWQRTSMSGFFSRILQSPSLLNKTPALRDYVHWVVEQTPRGVIYQLDRISEIGSRKSLHIWRRPTKKRPSPMAEVYPFITSTPTEDHDLLLAVDRLVPKGIAADVRADLCQDMIVSILTGEIAIENLRDATPQYVKRLYKEMPSKYGHLSLDTQLFYGDGESKTLGDTII
jgi:hypothetical protein